MSDDQPIIYKRTTFGLVPFNDAARDAMGEIAVGAIVRVRATKPRSGPHSRKFWALMDAVADAADEREGWTAKRAANVVKILTGHTEIVRMPDGSLVEWPASIAFDKMDQAEFNRFYEKALAVVTREILPKVERADLRNHIEGLLAA